MRCSQKKNCDNPPAYRYTWAGQNEAFACAIHAIGIQRLAAAMDYPLQMIALTIADHITAAEESA